MPNQQWPLTVHMLINAVIEDEFGACHINYFKKRKFGAN
jgi:hypothetical protein